MTHADLVVVGDAMPDPAPPLPLSEESLRRLDVIRANAGEPEVLTRVVVRDVRSAAQCGHGLVPRGVGAAITRAVDALVLVVAREERHLLPELPIDGVDATAEGNVFVAGLAAALAAGRSVVDAASFGGAAVATRSPFCETARQGRYLSDANGIEDVRDPADPSLAGVDVPGLTRGTRGLRTVAGRTILDPRGQGARRKRCVSCSEFGVASALPPQSCHNNNC